MRIDYDPSADDSEPYGPDWTQRGVLKKIDPASILAEEMKHLYPQDCDDFFDVIRGAADNQGRADCLCAIVAGVPVSIFQDVHLTCAGEQFPRPDIAESSPVPQGPNADTSETPLLPIGGVESPLQMYWAHRADYIKKNGNGQYVHFNHLDSGAWNKLWVCFLPARYEAGEKRQNAYFHTKVNDVTVFEGELKSGTRSSRRFEDDGVKKDPEKSVYVDNEGDKRIRLLGHWGSTVKYQKITIRSIGSQE